MYVTEDGMDLQDPDYQFSLDNTKHSLTQNTHSIPNLAMAMRRAGMSARDCATVANAAMIDYGVNSKDNTSAEKTAQWWNA